MRALRSFAVRASLPEQLAPLRVIATNLRWSWDARAVDLFRWVDPQAWESSGHDPIQMLGLVSRDRLAELADNGPFLSLLQSVEEGLERYLTEPRWFQQHDSGVALRQIAYFSPEFGLAEALPIYSGGLGILAGDHLKAASDLGVPLVAVGLLYREGYFRQQLNQDGWQQERYPAVDPHGMPLTLLTTGDGTPVKIEVDLQDVSCAAQLWQASVGRVPLLLLDCDVEDNDMQERRVTDRLYPGGSEPRLRQEIVLGIGGVRALQAAGYDAGVFHTNEGHAGFLAFERIRRLATATDLAFVEALEATRASTIFTTHTPVPAGIDVYDGELMKRYFESFAKDCGITFAELIGLGQRNHAGAAGDESGAFNMAIMALRLAGFSNGVSKLHGHVSRGMFAELWPDVPEDEVPISSITNGVHVPTWLGPEMAGILGRRLSPGWAETGGARWDSIEEVPDAELWRARTQARERLVYFVRERMQAQLLARGVSEAEAAWWTENLFDPSILTIGFARRFAQYKRGMLILHDLDRLKELLLSDIRPIQIVLAGKAHPMDQGGKEIIRELVHFASDAEVRGRFAFIEDYDMEVGRMLTQGVDVWLNNPRRPLEACGTSGMKAAINGGLNCSVLDGWWDECYDGRNGWAIGTRDASADADYQDRVDASALYDLLAREIVPRFYDRSEGPIPRRWLGRMKGSIGRLGGYVGADRMVRDYVERLYIPAASKGAALGAGDYERARALARWKARVRAGWPGVSVRDVAGDITAADVGEERSVTATVSLGELGTGDVVVQAAHGRVGANGELMSPSVTDLTPGDGHGDGFRYVGSFTAQSPGLYGFAVRVLPAHEDLTGAMDLGLVAWA